MKTGVISENTAPPANTCHTFSPLTGKRFMCVMATAFRRSKKKKKRRKTRYTKWDQVFIKSRALSSPVALYSLTPLLSLLSVQWWANPWSFCFKLPLWSRKEPVCGVNLHLAQVDGLGFCSQHALHFTSQVCVNWLGGMASLAESWEGYKTGYKTGKAVKPEFKTIKMSEKVLNVAQWVPGDLVNRRRLKKSWIQMDWM